MANFSNNAITEQGRLLFADVQAGAVFIPTKIVMGSGNMPAGSTPATMTDVVTPVRELTINKIEKTSDGKCIIGGVFSNQGLSTPFYFRELALCARAEYRAADGTVTRSIAECVYSYGNAAGTADYMPAYSTDTVVEKQMDVVVYIGSNAVVSLTIESGVYITREQALALIAENVPDADIFILDRTTGLKYAWGIDNGAVFLEEVAQ